MTRTGVLKGDEVAGAAGVASQSTTPAKDEIGSGHTGKYLKSRLVGVG
jgi:hypothetical protein